jgi:glycosyltransferase involved in cell wall biosynthesis
MREETTTILFAGHDFKFLRPILRHFEERSDVDVLCDEYSGHDIKDTARSAALLERADVIFCEWSLGNARWYSHHKRADQRLVIRLHAQEIRPPADVRLAEIEWRNVDRIVFICQRNMDRFLERFPEMTDRARLIYNLVETDRLDRPKRADAPFTLGLLGSAPRSKAPHLALEILERLRERDSRYRLSIKGRHPWEYSWLWKQKVEREYYEPLYERLRALESSGAVVLEEHGDDVDDWFRSVGFILSTSEHEGSHQAVAEGMASGAVPIIRNWPGSETLYPHRYIFASVDEACDLVLAHAERTTLVETGEAMKRYARRHFDSAVILARYDAMLDEVLSAPARLAPVAIDAPPPVTEPVDPLAARLHAVLAAVAPDGAQVAVVSKGDDRLLAIPSRRGRHFPEGDDGAYAGHYPGDGSEAIEQLERMRGSGAEYLALPAPSFWWLEFYPELYHHLLERYRLVAYVEETCIVFSLSDASDAATRRLAETIGRALVGAGAEETVRS